MVSHNIVFTFPTDKNALFFSIRIHAEGKFICKFCACPDCAFHQNLSVVGIHNKSGNGKAQTCSCYLLISGFICTEEAIKKSRNILRFNANPISSNDNNPLYNVGGINAIQVTFPNLLQPLQGLLAQRVSVLGRTTSFKLVHPLNASTPIAEIPSGIIKVVNFVQFWNT